MTLCDWKTSVQPEGSIPKDALCMQRSACCPGQASALPGPRAADFPAGNGTGVCSGSLRASRAHQGRLHLRKAPGSPSSPGSPKPHVLSSISRHENAVKYFWTFPAPSGISGAASCWEQGDCTCDSDTARSNATPGKHQVQASILSAKTPLNKIFNHLQKRQLLF